MTLILLILPVPESAVQTAMDMIRYPGRHPDSRMSRDKVQVKMGGGLPDFIGFGVGFNGLALWPIDETASC